MKKISIQILLGIVWFITGLHCIPEFLREYRNKKYNDVNTIMFSRLRLHFLLRESCMEFHRHALLRFARRANSVLSLLYCLPGQYLAQFSVVHQAQLSHAGPDSGFCQSIE